MSRQVYHCPPSFKRPIADFFRRHGKSFEDFVKTCAIPLRISSRKNDWKAQFRDALQKAMELEAKPVFIVLDVYSATTEISERPHVKKIIDLSGIDFVVSSSFDRISANPNDAMFFYECIESKNIEIHTKEEGHIDLIDKAYELALIGQKTRTVKKQQAEIRVAQRKKHGLCYSNPKYGFKIGDSKKLIQCQYEQSVIQICKYYRSAGMPYKAIAANLNENGYRNRKGNNFTPDAIRRVILGNAAYLTKPDVNLIYPQMWSATPQELVEDLNKTLNQGKRRYTPQSVGRTIVKMTHQKFNLYYQGRLIREKAGVHGQ